VERNLEEHEGIIEAVRRKDPTMLREQLITHYDIRKMHDRI
jgi:DNA-binding GntR family transcriptional regulator